MHQGELGGQRVSYRTWSQIIIRSGPALKTMSDFASFAKHLLFPASEQALDLVPLPLVRTEADLLRKRWSSKKKVKPVSSVSTEEQLHRRDGGRRRPITHHLMV